MKFYTRTGTVILLLCFAASSPAEDSYDTDWLSPKQGFEENKMGARIDSVTEVHEGLQRILISLPDADVPIEEVVVIGKRTDKPEIEQPRRFEYINDLDSGRRGIVIYIGKRQKFALKFNYNEGDARFPYD